MPESAWMRRVDVINKMIQEVRDINEANGWFDANRTVGDGMALLHSEVSEAFDAWRKHGFQDILTYPALNRTYTSANIPVAKPEGYGSELADVLIRLLDQCDRDGVDLVKEFNRKLAYNKTREYRHGGRAV